MKRGFSLIEVMVSSVLLLVGVGAAISAYSTLSLQLNHATHRSTAGVLAEATLEEMILRYPEDPEITLGDHSANPRYFDKMGQRIVGASPDKVFTVTWTVAAYAKVQSIREVTAKIAWSDLGGARTLELSTWRN